ncbi:ABC transporter permease subunit [Streptomyces sp. NPDC126514]|uniref:ABC transporter permease n=1 Tax=Streptomyces sp. NPDC126514 TaxID=3155210 RepID=UPI00332448B9
MTTSGTPATGDEDARHRARASRAAARGGLRYLGLLPFLAYVGVFLVFPTFIVVLGAFQDGQGNVSLTNVRALTQRVYLEAYARSLQLSAASAAIGAVLGALLAWALSTANPRGPLRRAASSACAVLSQFGGVTLAFAFIATFGLTGLVTEFLKDHFSIDLFSYGPWLFELPGLTLVYSYFQIPLMVIVFLPALEGLRPQWRDAVHSLGGSTWHYWRHVAIPLLAPAFLGSTLLLFANAFSAYATAAALVSQGSPLVPLKIRAYFTSEVLLGQENIGKALGLSMIVVAAAVMVFYALLLRRATRWWR